MGGRDCRLNGLYRTNGAAAASEPGAALLCAWLILRAGRDSAERRQYIKAGRLQDKVAKRRNAASPTGKMDDAWDVAYAALYLASDEAKHVNGTHIIVDGGLSARAV